MFQRRDLPERLEAVRAAHAPDCVVLDVDADVDTLPPAVAEDLGLFVDSLDPATAPGEWLPDDAPAIVERYAGSDFLVGMPDDGTVAWTRQTVPPTVLVKARAEGTPEEFLDFLLAEAFVRIGLGVPERFVGFFEERYRDLDAAVDLDPAATYQIAAALYDGWLGLRTRETFRSWSEDHPDLHAAWVDAGERLVGRLDGLPREVARGETTFPAATELACAALKHDIDLPAPFAALNTSAYAEYGADYAVTWAEKTFAQLREGEDGS